MRGVDGNTWVGEREEPEEMRDRSRVVGEEKEGKGENWRGALWKGKMGGVVDEESQGKG